LEKNVAYSSDLGNTLSEAQKKVIKDEISPWVSTLWQAIGYPRILEAVRRAAKVMEKFPRPCDFQEALLREKIDAKPIIKEKWDSKLRNKVIKGLHRMGLVLVGAADLEWKFTLYGAQLPTLEIQHKFVMEYIEMYTLRQ
jgi:hypothetical protein